MSTLTHMTLKEHLIFKKTESDNKDFDWDFYTAKILAFCEEWLSEKESFTLYTSGSTGTPKAIEITRKQMKASAAMTVNALGLKKGDRSLICINTNYVGGLMMLVRGLETGMFMTVVPPASNPLSSFDEGIHFDFTALVPLQMQSILENYPDKASIVNNMKAIILGGAPVSEKLEADLQTLSAPVFSTYGMTETVSHIALRRLNGPEKSDLYHVLPGISIGQDERSCLTINGAVTANVTIVTNDLVEIYDPAKFKWLGRADNVINSGGIKIQTDILEKKIAAVFNKLNIGNPFFITATENERFGSVVTLVTEGDWPAETREKFYTELQKDVTKYEIPRTLIKLEKFVYTPSGKLDKQATKKLLTFL